MPLTVVEQQFFETRTSGVVYRGINCSGFVFLADENYPSLEFKYDPFLAYFMGMRVEVPKGRSWVEPNTKAYLYADAESLLQQALKISDAVPEENNKIIKIATIYSNSTKITKIENTLTPFSKVFIHMLDERFKMHNHDGVTSQFIDIDDQLSEYFDIPNDFLTIKYDSLGRVRKIDIFTDKAKQVLLYTRKFFYGANSFIKKTTKGGRKFISKYNNDGTLRSMSDEQI